MQIYFSETCRNKGNIHYPPHIAGFCKAYSFDKLMQGKNDNIEMCGWRITCCPSVTIKPIVFNVQKCYNLTKALPMYKKLKNLHLMKHF